MDIEKLNDQKNILINQVDELIKVKKKLYSNMDITTPMSDDEKKLNKEISALFSEINQIILLKRKITKP